MSRTIAERTRRAPVIRLFVDDDLAAEVRIEIGADPSHYLANVMRLPLGGEVLLFNGRDGEWRARFDSVSKRGGVLSVLAQTRAHALGPDLDLIVALVKRGRLETIVEKAAELGARRVRLAVTERTNVDRTNLARLTAIAAEAAEQTGRLDVPEIVAPEKLAAILGNWDEARRLMFCDEAGDAARPVDALQGEVGGAWAILIGPEGGLTAFERALVRDLSASTPVSLGPRILRADTAAIAAMTLWQAHLGDWRGA